MKKKKKQNFHVNKLDTGAKCRPVHRKGVGLHQLEALTQDDHDWYQRSAVDVDRTPHLLEYRLTWDMICVVALLEAYLNHNVSWRPWGRPRLVVSTTARMDAFRGCGSHGSAVVHHVSKQSAWVGRKYSHQPTPQKVYPIGKGTTSPSHATIPLERL